MINLQVENFTYQMFKSIYRDILKSNKIKKLSYEQLKEKIKETDNYFIQYLEANKSKLKYNDQDSWNFYGYLQNRNNKLKKKIAEENINLTEEDLTLDFIYDLFEKGYNEVAYILSCRLITGYNVFHFNGFYWYSDITINIFRKMPDKLWNYIKNYLISLELVTEDDIKDISVHDKICLYISCLFIWSNPESCLINSYLSQFNIQSKLEGSATIKSLIYKDYSTSETMSYRYIFNVERGKETSKFVSKTEKYTGLFKRTLIDSYYYSVKDFKIDSKVVAYFDNKELYKTLFLNMLAKTKIRKLETAALFIYTVYVNSYHKDTEFISSQHGVRFKMSIDNDELYDELTDAFMKSLSEKLKESKSESHYRILLALLENGLDKIYPDTFSFLNDKKKQNRLKAINMKIVLEK